MNQRQRGEPATINRDESEKTFTMSFIVFWGFLLFSLLLMSQLVKHVNLDVESWRRCVRTHVAMELRHAYQIGGKHVSCE